MTELEWLACTDTYPMLNPFEGTVSRRKCYLISVACLRRIWHRLTDERSRRLVEVIERWADGQARDDALDAVAMPWSAAYENSDLRDEAGRGDGWEALRNL